MVITLSCTGESPGCWLRACSQAPEILSSWSAAGPRNLDFYQQRRGPKPYTPRNTDPGPRGRLTDEEESENLGRAPEINKAASNQPTLIGIVGSWTEGAASHAEKPDQICRGPGPL